ncbi:MAG TPA: ThuA domain-containing protein [Polyangiales bacterium]|nr:ThuA domain-containing protein [Polyangiales bacterium]
MHRLACGLSLVLLLACDAASDDSDAGAGAGGAGQSAGGGRSGAGASGSGGAGTGPAADGGGEGDAGSDDAGSAPQPLRIQVFSRTLGFRHESIEPAQAALRSIAARISAKLELGEDPAQLVTRLADTDVVVFLMTTGDVLDAAQQTAFERFIRDGGGFVGVHSAADTEYDWPFYGALNGAWFKDHPAVQKAKLVVDAPSHPIVSSLPASWERSDEWYNFRDNPRGKVDVLLRLDESSYSGGNMGADHPIAWCHAIDRGRAFYTGLGHTNESWQDAFVLQHVERALLWVARR